MKSMTWMKAVFFVGIAGVGLAVVGCGGEGGEGPIVAPPPPPAEYADKHMPAGWFADDKIVEEGRQLFIGAKNPDVNCASCHGKDGKPVKAGARDFRVAERMKLYSDSVWFWRISEGVPNTKMKAWKSKLPEEDRWKLVAFERSFGLKGQEWDQTKNAWVPVGGAATGGAAPAAAPDAGGAAPAVPGAPAAPAAPAGGAPAASPAPAAAGK
ncbi:MAG: cytochrome c [Nitrospirae bacterium]|nr:cytochrome c [Nitrospirota bacterium]